MISLIIATIQIETQTLTKIENKHTIWQASIDNNFFQVTINKINMPFNSKTASNAGKISKRGKSLNIDLRNELKTLITHILKDLDYNTLNKTQKLKLLDIALKHS